MKAAIQRANYRLNKKKKALQRILGKRLDVNKTAIRRMLIDDLHHWPYKVIQERALRDEQRQDRKKSVHEVENNFN